MFMFTSIPPRQRFLHGQAVDNYPLWKDMQRQALAQDIANMNASNPIVVNPSGGDDHADLTQAITDAQSGNRLVKISSAGALDITAGTGAGSAYAPKTNGSPVTIYSEPDVGNITGTKYWELDTGTKLVGLRMGNTNGGTLRPRIASGGLNDMSAVGCKFDGGNYAYKEESGSGNSRTNVDLRWCEFTAPTTGNDIFLFSSWGVRITDNWFAGGAAAGRCVRYGGHNLVFQRNRIVDGLTGCTFLTQNGATGSSSPYNFPAYQSPIGDVISDNYITGILEESISYDTQANSVPGHACIGMGVVSSKDSTGGVYIITFNTKTNGTTSDGVGGASGIGAIGTDNTLLYRNPLGKFVVFQTGSMAGKVAMIGDIGVSSAGVGFIRLCTPNVPSGTNGTATSSSCTPSNLAFLRVAGTSVGRRERVNPAELTITDFSSISNGDRFYVGDIAYDCEIENNHIEVTGYSGRNTKGIVLWGMGNGMRIRNNRLIDAGTEGGNLSKAGISTRHITGVARKADAYSAAVGGSETVQFMCSHNETVDNDLGGLLLELNNAAYDTVAKMWTAVAPHKTARNRNCSGGGPVIGNWIGTDGTVSGPVSTFATDSASVFGNS